MLHNIWIATDLHLFNKDADNRHPHRSEQEMNQIADNYGNMIQEDDLFIFLGDLYDPGTVDASEVANYIHNIKGYKIMCRGNHDTESYDFYRELGFDDVCDILRIHNLIFSHKPVKIAPDELNIHGDLHTKKLSTLGYQYINAYASNYNDGCQPVLLDDLIDSALVQNSDQIKPLDKVDEKFEEFTSNRTSVTYRNVRDLSDQFSLAPMDESASKKDNRLNLFFVSEHGDYNETIVQPKIPDNYMTQNGFEDNTTPRVCFSTSIDGCLMALSQNITDKVFYVYQPVGKHKVITPTEKQVPDVKITKERWICEPVELTSIGKIKAIDVNGPKDDGIPYRYGPNKEHEARLYAWGHKWIVKFNESISPSIVSLSAEVKEDEDEEHDPMNEILFPDVDSTRYWEADDSSLDKKLDGQKFADDRPTHKMIGKNDVTADGESTLDEDVNFLVPKHPEMIIKTQYLDQDKVTPKTISILAKDLFGERAMIHPEYLDQQKLATMKTVSELVDYFNSMAMFIDGSATRSPNGVNIKTPNFIVGAFLFTNRKKNSDAIPESELDQLLPNRLSNPEAFKEYINNSVEALNELEGILCSMICANLAMIRISINDVINQLMTPGGKKTIIKRAKDYIDDHMDEFVTKFSDGTVCYDYKKLGIDCEVFISERMYNGSEFKKINRPSRFLVRTAVYDKILVVHGATEQLDHCKYKWTIEPTTIYGKQYTDLDDVIKVFKTMHAGRILVLSCNTDGIVPDNALYDIVDYASGEVIFESASFMINKNGSPESVLKSIQRHTEKRIKELNKIESKVLSEIDSFDIVIAPDEFSYVEIDGSPIKAKLITKQMPNNIKKYKKLCGTTTDKLFKFYKEFMFVVYQYTKRLVQASLSESGYHWDVNDSIEVEDLLFHEDSSNYQSQSVIDNPTGGYHYDTLDECMHDVALYAEASSNSIYSFNINGGVVDEIQVAINEDAYEWLSTHNMEDHPLIKRINDIHSTPSVKVSKIGESEVFFTKEITPESLNKIFSLIYMPGNLPNGWKNMVKISTGEPGGNNYLKPELIGELVKRINGVICDTVTAYNGNRDTKEKQLETMKDHGFTDIGEVDVLDGDGELVVPVKDGLILKESLAGSHIMDYDFHLILTHFKGHAMAGFGGAIKNVAIGCSSRRGKSLIHTYGSTADMTIGFGDEYDQQSFLKAMVDAAKSYVDLMKLSGPILYINIANNLSVDCDCNDHPADPTMEDIGIFASWDPVAVDQACIDAVHHAKDSHDLVERIESKDGTDILLYAEDVGLGTRNYELISIDSVNETTNGLETVNDEIKVGNESLTIKKKVSENPNDPVGKLAHDLTFYLDGKKIAEISISAVDSNKAFLYNFGVNSKYRGKGYGTAILKYVLSHYKVNELTVDKSNTKAIKLYKRFGFKTGVEFKEDGKTRVDMKINLNESTYVSKHQFNGYVETLYHLDAFRKAYQVSGNVSYGIPDGVDTVCTFFEDILDNYNQIAPETLDRDKVAACKSADDLIELFYDRAKQFGDDLSSEYTSSLEMLHHLINLKKNPKNHARFDEIIPMNLSKDKFAAFIAKRVQEMDDIEAFLTSALKSNLQMYGIIRKEIQMLESDSTNKEHVKALKAYMDKHEDDFVHIHKKNSIKTYEYDFDSFGRGKVYVDSTIYETSHDVVKPTRLLIRASMYDYIVYSHGVDSDTGYAIDDIVIDGQVFNNIADIVTYLQKGAPKRILIMACNNNQVIYDSNDLRFANVKYPSHEIVLESALNISSSNPNKMLKEWDAYLNNRLGTLNHVRKRLVHQISDDEFILYPNKCKLLFAKSNAKDGKLIYQESFNISDRTMFVNAVVSSIESIVRLYEQVCFTCKMMIHIIHDVYNDTLTESGYGWEIKPVTGVSWSPDDYRFGYQYHTIQECFHDLTICHELFFESTNCCGRIYSIENPKHWCFTSKTLEPAILEAYYKYSKSELREAIDQFIHAQNETKEYLRTDNIHAMSREEEKNVAEKYGLRAVGQEVPAEEEKRRQTPEERYAERNKKRQEALKKARKAKKRKAFARKVKSHLPFVNNEEVELIRESESAVNTSDVDTPDGVEHSPLYGDKKDFFYNYDYPKSVNAYAERLKLEESTVYHESYSKSKHEEDPLTKKELVQYGIRDLRTFQRWLKNNVKYKNMTTLMSPREVLEQKRGSCHDQVVFELAVLKVLGYSPSAYFVLEHDNKPTSSQGGETHSYVVVKDNGKLYWLENAWSNHAGLNEVTNPKFIIQAHQERVWGDSNKFPELEVVHFAGQYGDSLQELVDHCFNDKQEESKEKKKEQTKSIRESYQFELVGEQVKFIDHLDESVSVNKKLYPVYIVLVHSGTAVSNAIKFVSKSEFSHASISFDSSLDHMYSFARKDPSNPLLGGFRYESIGKGFYDKKEIPYALYVVPCTANQIKKMKKRLNYFIQNESKFQFDFAGLVKNYLGIVDNPEYRWFCSRFVADILNAGAPKNKPYVAEPSLQDPDDFKNADYATYVIGGSNLMKYNRKLVDKRTNAIIREAETAMSIRNESVLTSVDPMNPYASMVLNYQFAMMDESVVDSFVAYLKSFKLKFDKDGNLIIRRREYDQLDQHFRASLRLMKAAEKAGDTGTVKDELCKINYMINLIQTQYMNQKTTDKNRKIKKEMEDLRSVMYNAFHQHLKWVVQMDPQFNFNSYYNSSKYGKDVVVDKKILTAAGKTIVTTLL